MATNFPTSLDSFVDPGPNDQMNVVVHHGQHDTLNDAVLALETKVGINGSTDHNSLDYKITQVTTSPIVNNQATNQTMIGPLTAPRFTANKLTPAGFIGETDGGHPGVGTYVANDWSLDKVTPGIWITPGGGVNPSDWVNLLGGALTSFQGRTTPAATLQSSDVTGLFTSNNRIFVGTGVGAGSQSDFLAILGNQFSAAGQLITASGAAGTTQRINPGAAGTVLTSQGSSSAPAYATPTAGPATGDVTGSLPGALTLATVNANVGTFGDATHTVTATVNAKGLITAISINAITPAGIGAIATGATVGGDLSGTLPNPTVAKVNGITVTGTPSNGQALVATSSSAATWQGISGTIPQSTQAGTTYTLVGADAGTIIFFTNTSPITVTVPSGVFSNNQIVQIAQYSSGQITLSPSGTVLNSFGASLKTAGEYAVVNIYCQNASTNTFLVSGMLL